jgi:hypothetical protein
MRPAAIPNWRNAWRMLTVQISAAAVVFGSLPVEAQGAVLDAVGVSPARVPAVLGVALLVARLIAQPGTR